jgi:hypothetical protein
MKKREALNMVLHIVVGGALAALVIWSYWFLILSTFVYAFLREQAQHRWIIENPDAPIAPIEQVIRWEVRKRTFWDFGWVTSWRMFEVLQWTAGAAAACLGYWLSFLIP